MKIVKSVTQHKITLGIRVEDVPVLEPLLGYAIFPRDVEVVWEYWSDDEPVPAWDATIEVRGPRRLVSGKPGQEHHGVKFYISSDGQIWAPYVKDNVKDTPEWLVELVDQTRPAQTKEA